MSKFKEILKTVAKSVADFYNRHSDIFRPIVVLTAICLVVAVLLSVTNLITKDKIANMEIEASNEAMAALISAESYEQIEVNGDGELYKAISGEELKGYIVKTQSRGYGGDIKIMTAISTDKKILGIKILSAADETPGLGQNVTKEDFYSRYIGKTENVSVVKNGANSDKNEIDAWTGATVSSKAVTTAVNEAFVCLNSYLETVEVVTETTGEVQ